MIRLPCHPPKWWLGSLLTIVVAMKETLTSVITVNARPHFSITHTQKYVQLSMRLLYYILHSGFSFPSKKPWQEWHITLFQHPHIPCHSYQAWGFSITESTNWQPMYKNQNVSKRMCWIGRHHHLRRPVSVHRQPSSSHSGLLRFYSSGEKCLLMFFTVL